jgi:hypothetical protein
LKIKNKLRTERRLLGVAIAQHLGEGHDLLLATTALGGLLVVTLGADVLDDVLALELLLQTAQGAVNRLVFADFDFDGHDESEVSFGGKAKK